MNRMNIHDRGYDEIPQHPLERLEPMRRRKSLRQSSFDSWPQNAAIRPDELINDGFYYMGMSDKVQCVHCGGVLSGWRKDDNVHKEHGRHFRRCPSLHGEIESDDIEIDGDGSFSGVSDGYNNVADNHDLIDHGKSTNNGYQFGKLSGKYDIVKPESKTIKLFNSSYSLYSERLESFKNWPSDHFLKPEDLASAGLYYKGETDKCQCFMCGGILAEWELEDEPESEHKKWFKKCPRSMLK